MSGLWNGAKQHCHSPFKLCLKRRPGGEPELPDGKGLTVNGVAIFKQRVLKKPQRKEKSRAGLIPDGGSGPNWPGADCGGEVRDNPCHSLTREA